METLAFLFYETFRISKVIGTESRLMVARGLGEAGLGSDYLISMRFPFGVMKCSGTR